MPPRLNSRYQFCVGYIDPTTGAVTLTDREPFSFTHFADNIQHQVVNGDTLQTIAQYYYSPIEDAALMWWVIADFQPTPIIDPTISLEIGRVLQVPSLATLQNIIFSQSRQQSSAT